MKILLTSDIHRGFSPRTADIHDKWAAETLAGLDYDVLVAAGDLGSSRKEHLHGALKFLRKVAGTKPVVAVMGNHDYWHSGQLSLSALHTQQQEWCREFDIHYLETGPLRVGGVLFVGWDGWYSEYPGTHDANYMPHGFDSWHHLKELTAFTQVLDDVAAAKAGPDAPVSVVAVTHFPCVPHLTWPEYSANPRHFQFLPGLVDVLCMGHSHKAVPDIVAEGVRLLNCGSDYDEPKAVLFEVPS